MGDVVFGPKNTQIGDHNLLITSSVGGGAAQPVPGRGVFVNYRHRDSGWAANSLVEVLNRRLPGSEIFLDNRSVAAGAEFGEEIVTAIWRSSVILVLIGPGWAEPPLGQRLWHPADWVRREIETARHAERVVVPVLVDRPSLPPREALPPELRFLVDLQSESIRQARPHDLDGVAARITRHLL